jgi:hypothetical protein
MIDGAWITQPEWNQETFTSFDRCMDNAVLYSQWSDQRPSTRVPLRFACTETKEGVRLIIRYDQYIPDEVL